MRAPAILLASSALFAFVLACGGRTPPPPRPLPSSVAYSDNSGGIQDSVRLVIRDAEDLRRVWADATAADLEPPPLPSADFQREMFVLVAAGRMNLEDQIRVESATLRHEPAQRGRGEDVLDVVVRITIACGEFTREAYPLQIVRLPRFDGTVRFDVRRERDTTC